MPYVFDRLGETLRAVLGVLEVHIARARRTARSAEGIPRRSQPVWSSPRAALSSPRERGERACEPADAFEQLRTMVDVYLTPVKR